MSSDDFRPILAFLQTETNRKFDELAVKVWFDGLQDLPTDAVKAAARRFVIEDGEWLSLAKIRRLAIEHIHGKLPGHGDAFELVMKAVRCFGSVDSKTALTKMPPIVRLAVLHCGGFGVFCDSPPDERNTLRAQFRMAFDGIAKREEQFRSLPVALRPRLATDLQSGSLSFVALQFEGRSGCGPRTMAESLAAFSNNSRPAMKDENR